jgi:hypothetical protein
MTLKSDLEALQKQVISHDLAESLVFKKIQLPESFAQSAAGVFNRQELLKAMLPMAELSLAKLPGLFPELDSRLKKMESEFQKAFAFANASALKNVSEAFARFHPSALDQVFLPKLTIPDFPKVDWAKLKKRQTTAAIRLGKSGWTVAAWMSFADIPALETVDDAEIDSYFVGNYLGGEGKQGELKPLAARLLSSVPLTRWRGLLEEVFENIENKKYRICVPALLTIIEGYIAESVFQRLRTPRKNLKVVRAIKDGKWHESDSIGAVMWLSVVTFLEQLFANSDFDADRPNLINRHWILHGRSVTDWTAVDALKLVNAVATLHWLFDEPGPSDLPGAKKKIEKAEFDADHKTCSRAPRPPLNFLRPAIVRRSAVRRFCCAHIDGAWWTA